MRDVLDPDGRTFRIEYRCLADGSCAFAFLLYNPWGMGANDYYKSHLRDDGLICIGPGIEEDYSPFTLDCVVERARFWAAGYSFYREYGFEATCRVISEWRG